MKRFFWSVFVIMLAIGSLRLYAQETRTLDGVIFTVIDPITYGFNADTETLRVGQRYVIDGRVAMINGATLYLQDVGGANEFRLNAPLRLNSGANVRVYAEITRLRGRNWVEANVIRIESR